MSGNIKHKIISVLVAVLLIIVIVIVAFGSRIKESLANGEEISLRWVLGLIYPEKYAYSTEQANLNDYFQLFSEDDTALIVNDEIYADNGLYINGEVYFKLSTAEALFTDRFYYNDTEQVLLYSTATDIYRVDLSSGSASYHYGGADVPLDYVPATVRNGELYIAADYVRLFDDFSFTYYPDPHRMVIYTESAVYNEAEIKKNTSVRYQGGIKSDVLCKVSAGDKVQVIEVLENWTKVKTADGFFGYVENNKLGEQYEATRDPGTGAYDPYLDYTPNHIDGNVIMVWHQMYFTDDGSSYDSSLNNLLSSGSGANVVSPTWFYLNNATGGYADYSSAAYVENAHNQGYQVWPMVADVENGGSFDFDEFELFSSSANRKTLIDNLINSVVSTGADGINVDIEHIGNQSGPHFVQFLRELAIETRKNGLVLSVDNYPMNQGNLYYDLREQGIIADYVVMMNYDEHWAGSDPGSLASIGFTEQTLVDAINMGVPASKLVNGVPFYTRIWKTEGSQVTSSAVGMDYTQDWISTRGITPEWNDECAQYYVKYVDGTATYEIWVEDKESMTARFNVMKNYDIAGVAGWKLGLESDDIWPLIRDNF